MTVTSTAGLAVSEVRQEICRHIARKMNPRSLRFQIRIVKPNGQAQEAWLYVHRGHEWKKQSDITFTASAVPQLEEQLQQIASREHTDDWTARRHGHADHVDFDIQFQREVVEQHRNGNLKSYLLGSLFERNRNSQKDARRSIRTPSAIRR